MHDPDSHFDAEDARVLSNLGDFAAAAYQVKTSLQQISDDHRRKDEFSWQRWRTSCGIPCQPFMRLATI